jgi:hypothetical protein
VGLDLWHGGLYRLWAGLAWGRILSQAFKALGRAFDVFGFQSLSRWDCFGGNREKELGQSSDTVNGKGEGFPLPDFAIPWERLSRRIYGAKC